MHSPIIVPVFAAAATAAGNLIEQHDISLSTMAAVFGVILPATWWLSRRLQAIEDNQAKLAGSIKEMSESVRGLPCKHPKCPDHSVR